MQKNYETQLKSILNSTYTIENFYNELDSIYMVLYPNNKDFSDIFSLKHYERQIFALGPEIGINVRDFQEKAKTDYQFPFFYGLVISAYFIKMVCDKQNLGVKRNPKNSFFNLVVNSNLEQIEDSDLYDFHQILTKVLFVGLCSKAFSKDYDDMKFSPNEDFFGLIDPKNLKHPDQLYYIKDNIDFITSRYVTTLKFKTDISLIKMNFIEDVSKKFNTIIDQLTKENVLDSISLFSPENKIYQDLVVNKSKRHEIEKKAAENLKESEILNSTFPDLDPDSNLFEDIYNDIFNTEDLESIGGQLQLPDKAILSVLLKIKIHSYVLSKSDLPSQLIFGYYKTILEDISDITDDFTLFCRKYLTIIDSYLYNLDTPPNSIEIIKMVYDDLSQENQPDHNHSNMLTPLNDKESKNLLAHFGMV